MDTYFITFRSDSKRHAELITNVVARMLRNDTPVELSDQRSKILMRIKIERLTGEAVSEMDKVSEIMKQ